MAVECAIRAKLKAVTKDTNSGHRLQELATEANYASRLKGDRLAGFNADLNEVDRLWDNLLRCCSATAYLQFLDRRSARIDTDYGRLQASQLSVYVGVSGLAQSFAEETYNGSVRLVKYGEDFWRKR